MSNDTASENGHDDEGSRAVRDARPESTSSDAAPSIATHESGDDAPGLGDSMDSDVLARGSTVGRYLVLERIGAGAMGVVYAAYDPELDRKIALKLLRPQQTEGDQTRRQARMVREAKAVAKVSHPNVVGIFDVGVHDGQVFMAMEHLSGGTLREWVATKKRTWREIVKIFIEVGHGLAAAHAEGLIHRDFKPDNVLLDKNGVPKVVDFGLVRLSAADLTESGAVREEQLETLSSGSRPILALSPAAAAAQLTRTGALTGTPAYMAPEQFASKNVDERTDQFAFCVSLFEALYGERPFAGGNIIALAESLISGRVREAPKNSALPAWVRRAVVRGLATNPKERWPSIEALVAVLADDPAMKRRRRTVIASAVGLALAGAVVTRNAVLSNRHEVEQRIAKYVSEADSALLTAETKRAASQSSRAQAFAAFDGVEQDRAEKVWADSLAKAREADAAYQRGIQRLDAAVTLSPRRDLKDRIADSLVAYLQMDGRTLMQREAGLRQLASYDELGQRLHRLNAAGRLRLETVPPGLEAQIEKYDPVTFSPSPATVAGSTPLDLDLAPGSYRLTVSGGTTHVGFHYPVLVGAGENLTATIRVPLRSQVPHGFVYVPAGRSLFGSSNEDVRSVFLSTVPSHPVNVSAFLIEEHETTIREWLDFLEALPVEQRARLRPHGRQDARSGFIDVRETGNGNWQIRYRATDTTYQANQGEAFRYKARNRRASQDWMRFPVTGVSAVDALEYVGWLDRSGRIPGARLCSEREWERAARGADGRDFPHGAQLLSDDANFDLTYGRNSGAFGPDEVGSHPASRSPFGLFDMSGNVWEITNSVLNRNQFVVRGGNFYQSRWTLVTSNRDPITSVTRDHTVGLRICANTPS